jgi:hypothetical protein
MFTLLVVILVVLLVTGGGAYGRRANWGPRGFVGLLLLVLIVILAIWAINEALMPPLPMLDNPPAISK